MMMFRPNDMNWELGIPMGQEERIKNGKAIGEKEHAVNVRMNLVGRVEIPEIPDKQVGQVNQQYRPGKVWDGSGDKS